ncbi:MAG: DUF1934 domain-containing protein [Halanaerobiales bacterium]|nr:DUF1934 domain-containing protein [Halanaerobiales bacterium]
MKRVKIKVNNKQTSPDGSKDEVSYEGEGDYKFKNDKHYLIYNESNKGLEDVKTILRLNESENNILLKRAQPNEMRQKFDMDNKCEFKYNLGSHKMNFTTDTKEIEMKIDDKKGKIKIKYDLLQGGQVFTSNNLKVEYRFIDKE